MIIFANMSENLRALPCSGTNLDEKVFVEAFFSCGFTALKNTYLHSDVGEQRVAPLLCGNVCKNPFFLRLLNAYLLELPSGFPRTVLPWTVLPWTVLPRTVLPWTVLSLTVLAWTVLPWTVLPWTVLPWTVLPWTVLPRTVLSVQVNVCGGKLWCPSQERKSG